jgi:predicted regulator of Ras-like GTPase activity (Roadblock/LC7/MglB family)
MPVSASRTASISDPVHVVVVKAPQGIEERLREAMEPLRKVQGFVSAAVTRRDGLVIHHTFPSARAAAGLSAMAAAMVGASRAAGAELGIGLPTYGFIYFEDGILLIQDAGPQAILACLLELGANIGYVITRISRISEQVREALEDL